MEEPSKNIDIIFKKHYENHSIEPNSELWTNINTSLSGKGAFNMFRIKQLMKITTVVGSICAVSVLGYYQLSSDNENKNVVIENKQVSIPIDTLKTQEIVVPIAEEKEVTEVKPTIKTEKKIVAPKTKLDTTTVNEVVKAKVDEPSKVEKVEKPKEVKDTPVYYRTLDDELMEDNVIIEDDSTQKHKRNRKD